MVVLIKGGKYIEKLSSIDTVVFDKTGTLTNGKPAVTDIISINNYNDYELLQLASSVEIKSEHPIAQAIVNKAVELSIKPLEISEFHSISGLGVLALFQEKKVFVGNVVGSRSNLRSNESFQKRLKIKLLI